MWDTSDLTKDDIIKCLLGLYMLKGVDVVMLASAVRRGFWLIHLSGLTSEKDAERILVLALQMYAISNSWIFFHATLWITLKMG